MISVATILPRGPPVKCLHVIVEEGKWQEQEGEPGQPIAGDNQNPHQSKQLSQQDVQDEGEAVINSILHT